MSESSLATARCLFTQALDALRGVAEAGSAGERLSVLTLCEGMARQLDQVTVAAVATLDRDGVLAERGYRSPVQALGDLLGWERFEARRRVTAAEQVTPRTGLDGAPLPARLPATAQVFATGRASLRHVEVIARVLATKTAERLSPEQWAGAEEQLAARVADYTPRELHEWGTALVELLDQDGEQPDDRPPAQINELLLTWLPRGGGKIKGRLDDAPCSMRSPRPSTPTPGRSPPTTTARWASGRPRPSRTCAATSSTTATSPSAAGTART